VADSLAEPICVGAALTVDKRSESRLTVSQTEFTIHRDPKLTGAEFFGDGVVKTNATKVGGANFKYNF
jgi:hypothetical protein